MTACDFESSGTHAGSSGKGCFFGGVEGGGPKRRAGSKSRDPLARVHFAVASCAGSVEAWRESGAAMKPSRVKERISAIAVLGAAFAMLVCAGCFDAGAPSGPMSAAYRPSGDPDLDFERDVGRVMQRESADDQRQTCEIQLESELARNGYGERQCEERCDTMHEGEREEERECERQCEAERETQDAQARGLERECE